MDISADVDQIIAQAPDWNFAGDCALLALMKRISQNLNERGEQTSRNLRDFETRVKQVDISLNNATNSLRSLQFGNQFVEYRVEEVDDADLAMPEERKKKKPELPPKSSEELAKEFLENNLRMFRKNFEPVTIEVPDSDDEDAPVHSTTVYRAKNPYDAIPLPYIIGTKEWEEHKYAGLYDSKENSGDEESEEFSSSSSDERESVSKKTTKGENKLEEPHQSDSSSLASFAREPVIVSPVVKPSVPVAEAAIKTQPRPIISSQRNPHERDMFAALRQSPPSDDPPSTSSSPTSSPAFRNPSNRLPIASTASLSSSSSSPAQQAPTLFDEAVSTQTPKETEAKQSQTMRKPVNLFNDDEFNSFMSEIVDKVQAKAGNSSVTPAKTISVREQPKEKESFEQNLKPEVPRQIVEQSVPKRVNLFDDSPPLSPTPKAVTVVDNAKASGAIPKQNPIRVSKKDQVKSLFDDSPALFASPKSTASNDPPKPLPKSLFDDDLEDDDFLSSFTPKTKPSEQKQLSKPQSSLFDDDDLDIDDIFIKPSNKPKNLSERVAGKTSLFEDDDQDDVADLFGSKKIRDIIKEPAPEISPDKKIEEPVPSKKSLFDDIDDEDLFGTPKAKNLIASKKDKGPQTLLKTELTVEKESKTVEGNQDNFIKQKVDVQQPQLIEDKPSTHLFRDSPPPIEVVEEKSRSKIDEAPVKNDKSALNDPKDLFNGNFSDEESFLSPSNIKVKPKSAIETKEPIAPTEQNTLAPVNSSTYSTKPTDLFNEELSDDDSFLSATKTKDKPEGAPATNKINKPAEYQLEDEIKPEEFARKLPENNYVKPTNDVVPEVLSDSQIDAPVSETPPPDDYQSSQDPIITMVADVTNKSREDVSTPRKPADLAAAQQIMQNYSNLFSDEPPDDSEFFQTLGSSGLSSLSASKIFDSEQDFFEPALPKIPSASKPSPGTPGDQPSSTSDYGGMCLFSDVPPEDDNRDVEEPQKQAETPKEGIAPTTTRIHTIFYDDFSETARQGALQPDRKPFTFDDEQPPADEPDRSKVNESSEVPAPTSPVKKLKMPNININVQALLPGSGGLPKVLRKQESSSVEREAREEPPNRVESSKYPSRSKESVIPSVEGGLQHVNKSRARGPSKRRPSTRKGRQENYAKSLLDAEKVPTPSNSIERKFIDKPDEEPSDSKPNKAPLPQSVASEKLYSPPALDILNEPPEFKPQLEPSAPSKSVASFLDSPDEDDSLFGSVTQQKVFPTKPFGVKRSSEAPKSYRSFLDSPDEDDLFSPDENLPPPVKNTSAVEKGPHFLPQSVSNYPPVDQQPPKLKSSFLDSADEDDSLFSPVKTVEAPIARKSSLPAAENLSQAKPAPSTLPNSNETAKEQKQQAALKLFDDSDDDDLFATAAVPAPLPSNQTNKPAQTKQPTKPASSSLFSSDEDEAEKPARIAPKKKLPVKTSNSLFSDDDDDDDLFGGGSSSKGNTTKKTKTVTRTVSKPTTSKAATPTATIPSSTNDNPLADLLE
ncbi:WASH complex subunit 2 [Drosophila ficusphila]|uniref:WASH complex subunit 2 n=1 Tax=Drosophila ficusphila TaxID=30025 RepID=UPI0007E7FEE0|nr:WASH complex subunit 2 [Drosophila ficusphila]